MYRLITFNNIYIYIYTYTYVSLSLSIYIYTHNSICLVLVGRLSLSASDLYDLFQQPTSGTEFPDAHVVISFVTNDMWSCILLK